MSDSEQVTRRSAISRDTHMRILKHGGCFHEGEPHERESRAPLTIMGALFVVGCIALALYAVGAI